MNQRSSARARFEALTTVAIIVIGAAATSGCRGHYASAAATTSPSSVRGVEAANLPYKILDARTGHELAPEEAWRALGAARAVCVGEDHPNPHHHWAQLEIVDHLAAAHGAGFGVGMEMVQRPFQGVLDDYAAGRIDDDALQSRTGWADRWGFDYALYRPILRHVVAAHGALIALNAAKELVHKVSHEGLAALTADERAALPELKLDDAVHRAWFDKVMEDMGGASAHQSHASDADAPAAPADASKPPPDPAQEAADAKAMADRIYSVQVLWDESMADGAARWLAADPQRAIVILAGNGHCHDSAIVGRLKRRGVAAAVSVRPIIAGHGDDDGDDIAAALAAPITDYLFVMTPPKP